MVPDFQTMKDLLLLVKIAEIIKIFLIQTILKIFLNKILEQLIKLIKKKVVKIELIHQVVSKILYRELSQRQFPILWDHWELKSIIK